jgi:hypothetical protein
MKKYLNYAIVGAVCLLVGRFVLQPKQEVKEVVKYVEKKEEMKKTKKVVKIKEEKKPDGTTSSETTITEDSNTETNTSISSSKETSIKTGSGVSVGILALKDLNKFSEKLEYGAVVSVPVFGSLSVIGSADTTKRVGLGVALEF